MKREIVDRPELDLKLSKIKGELSKMVDYIVEEGTTSIWSYRKWNSGIAECWGKFSQTVSAYTTSGFVVGGSSVSPYPFTFASAPVLQVHVQRVGTGGGLATYDYECTDYANFIVNTLVTIAQGTSRDIVCKCYAIGRWK